MLGSLCYNRYMLIRENVPIAALTTMRLGGPAKFVLEVRNNDDVVAAYDFAKERNLSTWVMGGGANTIGLDAGFEGAILLNRASGIEVISEDDTELTIKCQGGEIWDNVVRFACERGHSGIEAMSLIPGTAGAAPVQNIGAYGQEVSQVIVNVDTYDTKTRQFVTLEKSEMDLGYRHTRFNAGVDKYRFFITAVTLQLKKAHMQPPFYASLQAYLDEHEIKDYSPMTIRAAVCAIRESKLPDPEKVASAGSFFKNVYVEKDEIAGVEANGIPVRREASGRGKVNAGWMVEQCGLKGKELYGFRVSDKAALVLINEKAKSYADLAKARAEIVEKVKNKFGLTLEQEPVEIPLKER